MPLDGPPHHATPESASVQKALSLLTTLQSALFTMIVCYNALIPEYRRAP